MKRDLFDIEIPPDAPVDPDILRDMKEGVGKLSRDIITSKTAEVKLFREAAADGGPISKGSAVGLLMQELKIGYRELASKAGIGRKVLVRMVEGEIDIPPEVLKKINAHFRAQAKRQKKDVGLS